MHNIAGQFVLPLAFPKQSFEEFQFVFFLKSLILSQTRTLHSILCQDLQTLQTIFKELCNIFLELCNRFLKLGDRFPVLGNIFLELCN